MRKLVVVLAVLVAVSAVAQEEKKNSVFVFVRNPAYGFSSNAGHHFDAAYGVALQRKFARRFSIELTASRASGSTAYTFITPGGDFQRRHRSWTVTPIDVGAYYHFVNGVSWKPYLGAAVRWINAPSEPGNEDSTTAGPAAGVVWYFRPNVGLRLDAKALFGNNMDYGDIINGSVGLAWRF